MRRKEHRLRLVAELRIGVYWLIKIDRTSTELLVTYSELSLVSNRHRHPFAKSAALSSDTGVGFNPRVVLRRWHARSQGTHESLVRSPTRSSLFQARTHLTLSPETLSQPQSHMLCTPNNLPPNLRPINTPIQLLIHQPTNHDIIAPHKVQPVRLFRRRLFVVLGPDDALDGIFEHEIGDLIAGDEGAG